MKRKKNVYFITLKYFLTKFKLKTNLHLHMFNTFSFYIPTKIALSYKANLKKFCTVNAKFKPGFNYGVKRQLYNKQSN